MSHSDFPWPDKQFELGGQAPAGSSASIATKPSVLPADCRSVWVHGPEGEDTSDIGPRGAIATTVKR
jgi:hypothetical protein